MKFLTHSKDKVGDFQDRVLLHIPIGFFIVLSGLINPFLPQAIERLFEKYELNEDSHTQDEAWKDMFGALVGTVIGFFFVGAVIVLLVIWLLKK